MQKKFKISVDGHAYDVVVEEVASEFTASGTFQQTAATAVAGAAAVAAPAPAAAPAAEKPVAGAGAEIAPLAGVVESVDVVVGQTVAAGAKIATIEAMKMKTEVFAKGAGTVASIAVKPGDPVDSGGVLLTLA
ncbi:acetyl-CoA carboxylase biotin carboxyl carrier protein subunit [Siculibacillus lacustris]|uniref:Acetyl-CoA carboxylase biotin carboxyl carrier protein subunit n=1 Tax=Siculibacillus lacustris TaxID=1549641 RepID=A0A4V2KSM7_9HYPH|nr:biotin/lipoyl-containing protein [Siculibacillus lacustris]TBW33568.1 acetyl-CoA carboxylase biotin carboxyl carrier protein subunit [Siculibacillus lacustris]